jgi:hypothetical protein
MGELEECMARCIKAETEVAHLREQNRILAADRDWQNQQNADMAATYNELARVILGDATFMSAVEACAEVMKLHVMDRDEHDEPWCVECMRVWPCPSVVILIKHSPKP